MAEPGRFRWRRRGLALAAAGLVVALACGRSAPDETADTPDTAGAAAAPVADYVEFARTVGEDAGAGSAEQSIAEGLRRLAGALGALGLVSSDVAIDLRISAEHVVLNPSSTDNVETIRAALIAAADAIAEREGTAANLRSIAEKISTSEPLAMQQNTLTEYFQASATAVEQIAGP